MKPDVQCLNSAEFCEVIGCLGTERVWRQSAGIALQGFIAVSLTFTLRACPRTMLSKHS